MTAPGSRRFAMIAFAFGTFRVKLTQISLLAVVGDHLTPVGIDVAKDRLSISPQCREICTKIHVTELRPMNTLKVLAIGDGDREDGQRRVGDEGHNDARFEGCVGGAAKWRRRHDKEGGQKRVGGFRLSVGVGSKAREENEKGSLGFYVFSSKIQCIDVDILSFVF